MFFRLFLCRRTREEKVAFVMRSVASSGLATGDGETAADGSGFASNVLVPAAPLQRGRSWDRRWLTCGLLLGRKFDACAKEGFRDDLIKGEDASSYPSSATDNQLYPKKDFKGLSNISLLFRPLLF